MTWRSMLCAAGLLTGVLVLPSCDKFMQGYNRSKKQREDQQQAFKDIEASKAEYAKAMEAGMTEDGLNPDAEALEKHQKNVQAAASKMGGKVGEALKVAMEEQAELGAKSKVLEQETEKFAEILDWPDLHKKQDYAERKAFLKKYKEMNQEFLEYFEGYGKRIEKRLDAISFQGKERSEFMTGLNSKKRQTDEIIRTIRTAEIEAATVCERILDLLENSKGKWSLEEDTEAVLFESDQQLETFEKEVTKLEEAAEKQTTAQKKYLQLLKK